MTAREILAVAVLAVMSIVATAAVRGADYDAAVSAANKRDYVAAAQEFQRLAEEGDPRGENGLGVLHANGLGVRKDATLAAQWFRKASDQGYKAAQNNLGELYLTGTGVGQDYEVAEQLFRAAAAQGDSDAQVNLGRIYAAGLGVKTDFAEAMDWFQRSPSRGTPPVRPMWDIFFAPVTESDGTI